MSNSALSTFTPNPVLDKETTSIVINEIWKQ